MTETLVVYYSFTGVTRPIAQELARQLDADLGEIRDRHPRTGFWGRFRTKWQATLGLGAAIEYGGPDPAAYTRVIIGTPVWAGGIAAPVRGFLRLFGAQCKEPALFFTYVSQGLPDAVAASTGLAAKPFPICGISNDEIQSGAAHEKLRAFAHKVAPDNVPA